jgi:hypothetical protein
VPAQRLDSTPRFIHIRRELNMTPRFDSSRFNPRRLPAIGTDGAALPLPLPLEEPICDAPGACPTEPAAGDFDLALEAMLSQKCRVCPLCGLIVARDGPLTT